MSRAEKNNRGSDGEISRLKARIASLESELDNHVKCNKIVELVSDIITISDSEGIITAASPSTKRWLDREPDGLIGTAIFDIIHPDDVEHAKEKLSSILKIPGKFVSTTLRVQHREGTYRQLETFSTNYTHDPDIRGIVNTSRDVTERIKAGHALMMERDRARRYLDVAGVILLFLDDNGVVTGINRRGCKVIGLPESEIKSSNWIEEYVFTDDRPQFRQMLDIVSADGDSDYGKFESRIISGNGDVREIIWHTTYLGGKGDGFVVLCSGEDVTEEKRANTLLKQSEENYRLMFEDNPYPMWVQGKASGAFLAVNRAMTEHYGYSREELLSMSTSDIAAGRSVDREHEPADDGASSMALHKTRDGALLYAEITSQRMVFNGKPADLVLAQDVTLQLQVQESLRMSEEKYHSLFTSMSEGVVVVQPVFDQSHEVTDFMVIDANPVFEAVFNVDKSELIGKTGSTFVRHKDLRYYLETVTLVMRTGKPYTIEVEYPLLGKILEASIFMVFEDAIATVFQDITERKRAEKEIQDNQERLARMLNNEKLITDIASMLNSSDDFGAIITDILQRLLDGAGLSHICLCTMGNSDDSSKDYFESRVIPHDDDCPKNCDECPFGIPEIITPVSMDRVFITEDTGRELNGEKSRFAAINVRSCVVLPMRISDSVVGMICFGKSSAGVWEHDVVDALKTAVDIIINAIERDYSMRARLDAERKQTLAVQMAERAARLASLGTVSAGIAHEINQPLNALMFAVDGMRYWMKRNQEIERDELEENLTFISEQVIRISGIVASMRSLAKTDARKEPEDVSFNDTVREVVSLISQQMLAHDIDIELDLDDSIRSIRTQPSKLQQIVTNLVVNAFQALDDFETDTKEIVVSTSASDGSVVLKVADTGPGVSSEALDHMYDPFFTTKAGKTAMGLGLFITHSIVLELDGIISVENVSGGGAVFTVAIPVTKSSGEAC